jgi:hypothetical protein
MASKQKSESKEVIVRRKPQWQVNRDEAAADDEDTPTIDAMQHSAKDGLSDLADRFGPSDEPAQEKDSEDDSPSFFDRMMKAGHDLVSSTSEKLKPGFDSASKSVNAAGDQFNKNIAPQKQELQADVERNKESAEALPSYGEGFVDRVGRVMDGTWDPFGYTDAVNAGRNARSQKDMGPPSYVTDQDKLTPYDMKKWGEDEAAAAAAKTPTTTQTKTKSTKTNSRKAAAPSGSGSSLADTIKAELDRPGQTTIPEQYIPDPTQRQRYQDEVDAAKQEYRDAQSNLDRREAIEAFANAIGRIGAGIAGLRTGTDMSKVEFGKQDWDKKRALASDNYKTDLAQAAEKRREGTAEDQFAAKYNQDAGQFAQRQDLDEKKFRTGAILDTKKETETERHNRASEANDAIRATFALDNKFLQQELAALRETNAQSAAQTKKLKDARVSISKIMNDKKLDNDGKAEELKSVFVNELDVAPEKAHDLVMKHGILWGENLKDPDELYKSLQDISAASQLDKSMVTVTKGGVQRRVTKPDSIRLQKFGWSVQ